MPSDKEFIQKRLEMVLRQSKTQEKTMIYEGEGRGRKATITDEVKQERAYQREARLLLHIAKFTKEGQVQRALTQWRKKFGAQLADHRERYRATIDAYDSWWELSYSERKRIPSPPRPPQAVYRDRSGDDWIIDDKFLLMIDDLRVRLEKWLQED